MSRIMCVALSVTTLACYNFRPVGLDEVAPGTEVRARVTAARAEELSAYLPSADDRVVHGTVIATPPGGLLLQVTVASRGVPGRVEPLNQRIELPVDDIFEVEERQFDRWKTGLLAAGGALLVSYVLYETLVGESSGTTPGPGDPGTTESIRLFHIPIGR